MAQAILLLLAALVGFALWSLTFALSQGNPLGKAGMAEGLVLFSPIVGAALPLCIRLFDSKSVTGAVWVLAIAPVLGFLNFIPYILLYTIAESFYGRHGASNPSSAIAATVSSAAWLIPLYFFSRKSKSSQQDEKEQPDATTVSKRDA